MHNQLIHTQRELQVVQQCLMSYAVHTRTLIESDIETTNQYPAMGPSAAVQIIKYFKIKDLSEKFIDIEQDCELQPDEYKLMDDVLEYNNELIGVPSEPGDSNKLYNIMNLQTRVKWIIKTQNKVDVCTYMYYNNS